MEVLQINDADKHLIENVITKIAEQNNINDVVSVDLNMTSEGSVVQFRQKEAVFDLNTTFQFAKLLLGTSNDPELQKAAEELVQREIDQDTSEIAPNEKDKYVKMIIGIVTTGAQKLVEQIKAEQAKQQKQWDQWNQKTQSSKTVREKIAQEGEEAGFLQSVGNWFTDLDATVSTKVNNLFSGPSRPELVKRLVDIASKKGGIPNKYKADFATYINNALDQGLGQMQQTLAQKQQGQQDQQGQKGQYPGNPKYERDPSTNQIKPYQRTDGGTAYRVTYDPSSGKKPIFVTSEPPHTLVQNNQIAQPGTQPEKKDEAYDWASETFMQPEGTQQEAPQGQTKQNSDELMKKEAVAIGAILKGIAKHAPELIALAKFIYEQWKKRKTAVAEFTGQSDEPEEKVGTIQGMIDTTLDFVNKIKAGMESELAGDILEALKEFNLDFTTSRDKIINLLEAFIDVLRTIQGEPEETGDVTDAEYTIEANYLKVNSETFNIKAGNTYYNELEHLMQKVAQEQGIQDVSEIEIELTNSTGEVLFRKVEAQDWLSGMASFAISKWYGENQDVSTSLLHGLGGAMTNLGYPLAVTVAKEFGFGVMGQAIAGGIGALAFHVLFGADAKEVRAKKLQEQLEVEKDERMQTFMEEVRKDPTWTKVVKNVSQSTGKHPEAIWETLLSGQAQAVEKAFFAPIP